MRQAPERRGSRTFALAAIVACLWLLAPSIVITSLASNASAPSLSLATPPILVSAPTHRISEFTASVDPRDPLHMAVAAIDWDDPQGGDGCATYLTTDGARSWSGGPNPEYSNDHHTNDPWLAFDGQGRLHALCGETSAGSDSNPGPYLMYYARSDDGGRTWGPRILLPMRDASSASLDKGVIGVDNAGNVFACFAEFNAGGLGNGGLEVTRSFDGGVLWSEPTPLGGISGSCNGLLQAPDGTLVIAFHGGGAVPAQSVGVVVSHDDGATWSAPRVIGARHIDSEYDPACAPARDTGLVACTQELATRPIATLESLAVSPLDGAIVLAYQNATPSGSDELVIARSIDDGRTFQPVAPPDTATICPGCDAVRPVVAFDARGRLGLKWDAMRGNTLTNPATAFFSASEDDGATWLTPVALGNESGVDSRWGPGEYVPSVDAQGLAQGLTASAQAPSAGEPLAIESGAESYALAPYGHAEGGDYEGMSATTDGFVAFWIDHEHVDGALDGAPHIWERIVTVT